MSDHGRYEGKYPRSLQFLIPYKRPSTADEPNPHAPQPATFPQRSNTTKESNTHALIAKRPPPPTCTPSAASSARIKLGPCSLAHLGRPVQSRRLHAACRCTPLIPHIRPQSLQRPSLGHVLLRVTPLAAELYLREKQERGPVVAAARGTCGKGVYPARGLGGFRIWLETGSLAHVFDGCAVMRAASRRFMENLSGLN